MADMVRGWAEEVMPGESMVADHAVAIALRCYEGGSSVAEACEAAKRFVGSCSRHPSQRTSVRNDLRRVS
jgi:hypothetical protein